MTASDNTKTVEITAPDITVVVESAVSVYQRVMTGDWAAVIDLVEDRFRDPNAIRGDLNKIAATEHRAGPTNLAVLADTPDRVLVTGSTSDLLAAVDLYTRIHLGQFDTLADVTASTITACDTLTNLRFEHQTPDGFPNHPRASWSIGNAEQVPDRARVAYDIWKHLGGGMPERPPITDLPIKVTVKD